MSFGVYLHWPFCRRICPYCDFNVRRWRGEGAEALFDATLADLSGHAARLGRRPVSSIHFGGGTPSLLAPGEVGRFIEAVAQRFSLTADAEIGLELNPEDADALPGLRASGVNRFSLGVQAFDDAALAALGREHSASEARAAVIAAAETGARVSLDLIYARPGQSLAAWEKELRGALALPIEHLSAYQLTIEPGTAFARAAARGRLQPPPNQEAAAFFSLTQALAREAGFPAYEISNHARGPRAQSRHNLLYWRGEEWIGLGPGAHGRFVREGRRRAARAWRELALYIEAVAASGVGWEEEAPLSLPEEGEELVLMGLRLSEGVELARAEALLGRTLEIAPLQAEGLAQVERGRLALTAKGRLLADRLAAQLLGA